MNPSMHRFLIVCATLLVSACSSLPPTVGLGPDQLACVGGAPAAISGLERIDNEALLSQARLESGKGGVCSAKTFLVKEATLVYRVFDGSNPYSRFGRWWTLDYPVGPRQGYRSRFGICEEWSGLDRLVACQLKAGTEIVVGTTQSATCKEMAYPKTADIQVYIPNDAYQGKLLVENCQEVRNWP